MILNLTNVNYNMFSAMQRLATRGNEVVTNPVTSMEEFEKLYSRYEGTVCAVIVDEKEDFVMLNDIVNYVECPVVTLRVQRDFDRGFWEFVEYEYR